MLHQRIVRIIGVVRDPHEFQPTVPSSTSKAKHPASGCGLLRCRWPHKHEKRCSMSQEVIRNSGACSAVSAAGAGGPLWRDLWRDLFPGPFPGPLPKCRCCDFELFVNRSVHGVFKLKSKSLESGVKIMIQEVSDGSMRFSAMKKGFALNPIPPTHVNI